MLKDIKAQRNNKHYLRKVKNSLALGDDYISRFLRTNGALEQLLSVTLRSVESSCQLEALACFTNLACGDHKATFRVLRCAGPYLITFLNGSNPFLQARSSIYPQVIDMAVLALQAYAQSPPDIIQMQKKLLCSLQALASLLVCLATWSSRSCDLASALAGMAGMVAALGRLLEAPYLHLRREALWLMHCLSGPLAQYDLAEISAAINGIVPLLTPGAEYITEQA
ncbi:hypothetical protein HPB52_008872 [Rhipicephalus sanguineus]|uniref:Uncharacterized protein n=1 Tax=Rhipicephalus sanguineus TaxID=34632 RepID=A0A9D4SWB5_RHISA|nr:hypothetical protein HPB52_008872 [Rhipicephalus sanguineus]